ncbi:MAG: thiol-disulfide oxidoreductase DCC family protein [Acidobacteria bacterium]|nr:thiol-disulfide oxidoreductase DCC family protein [Acidobacteriota bacterium]
MGAIVLFDGVCNFCDGAVRFIIERDRRDYFKFAPLESETGKELVAKHGLGGLDSIVLIEDERAFAHSTAALRIARRLSAGWPLLYVFIAVPKPIRDFFYKWFARHRYRLFGKKDECMMPTPEIRAKFL